MNKQTKKLLSKRGEIEYVQVGDPEEGLLWRISYSDGTAGYTPSAYEDLEFNEMSHTIIEHDGGIEDYLEDLGVKNLHSVGFDEYEFEAID